MNQSEYMAEMFALAAEFSAKMSVLMAKMSQQSMADREPPKLEQGGQRYMTSRAAAKYLGLSEAKLSLWRTKGNGPPYSRIDDSPAGQARYRQSDLDKFMEPKTK